VPLILDSTVLIDVLRGRPAGERLRDMLARKEVPFACAVTVDEVMRGVREDDAGRATATLLNLRVAPLGINEGALAGLWRRDFARRGITLHQADCLIAAAAVGVHATIATGNPKDFPMDGVTVEHWPVGE